MDFDGSKNYGVRYVVTAECAGALTQLQELQTLVDRFDITKIQTGLKSIKALFNEPWTLILNTEPFYKSLRAMEGEVRRTAAKMQQSLYNAFTGHGVGKSAMQKAGKGFFRQKSDNDIKQIIAARKKAIQSAADEIKRLQSQATSKLNTARINDLRRNITAWGNENKEAEKVLNERRAAKERRALQQDKKAAEKAAKAQEKFREQVRKETAAKTGPYAPLTNATPKVIQSWAKHFGKSKTVTLTLKIQGNIEDMKLKLNQLCVAREAFIAPMIDEAKFQSVRARLESLAAMGTTILGKSGTTTGNTKGNAGTSGTKPFTPPKFGLNDRRSLNSANSKMAAANERFDKAVAAYTKSEEDVKKDPSAQNIAKKEKAAAALSAAGKKQTDLVSKVNKLSAKRFQSVSYRQLSESEALSGQQAVDRLKQLYNTSLTRKLSKEEKQERADKQQFIKGLRGKNPPAVIPSPASVATSNGVTSVKFKQPEPLKLTLDTTGAMAKFENFINFIRRNNPQRLMLMASVPGAPSEEKGWGAKYSKGQIKKSADKGKTGATILAANPKVQPNIKQEAFKNTLPKEHPITLTLNTDAAIANLNTFIAEVKAKSPQVINLTAQGTMPGAGGKKITPITPLLPLDKNGKVNLTGAGAKTSVKPPYALPTVPGHLNVKQDGFKGNLPKLPTIDLNLNTTPAASKLESFIATVKAASPQTITLTAQGMMPGAGAKGTSSIMPPLLPLGQNGKVNLMGAGSGAKSSVMPPYALPGGVGANISNQNGGSSNGTEGHQASTAMPAKPNVPQTNSPKLVKAPTGFVGSGKNMVYFGKDKPSAALAPAGMHWEKTNELQHRLNASQKGTFNTLAGAEREAHHNLQSTQGEVRGQLQQIRTSEPTSKRLSQLGTRFTQAQALHTQFVRDWRKQIIAQNKLEAQIRPLAEKKTKLENLRSALQKQGANDVGTKESISFLNKQINDLDKQLAPLIQQRDAALQKANQSRDAAASLVRTRNRLATQIADEKKSARSKAMAAPLANLKASAKAYGDAKAAAAPYRSGYHLVPNEQSKAAPTARETRLAKAMEARTAWEKSLQKVTRTQAEANVVAKYRPHFLRAAGQMSISSPSAYMEMSAVQQLEYLKRVQASMAQSHIVAPAALDNRVKSMEQQMNRENVAAAQSRTRMAPMPMRMPKQVPFFERARRWAYPFTGQTSFGARTPMAVDMAKGMGVMFAIGGAMSAISNSFGQAVEYQNVMETTKGILEHGTDSYSVDGFKNMERIVREVGVKTKFSAPEVASAAKFLAMAGFDIDAINAAIRPIADLALISDADLGEVADKMTNIMSNFNIKSEDLKRDPNKLRAFGNIITTTATRTNTDPLMLAESAKYGGNVAYMYNRNDPNVFADTMALFGVMGNSGIQGSAAGTALRMMYMNIFNPNKKQQLVLKQLEEKGVKRFNADGSKKSMADIVTQIANAVPDNQLDDVMARLFRITAMPGASSAVLAAVDENAKRLQELAQEDGTNIEEVAKSAEGLADSITNRKKLSVLGALIQANRASADGNILGIQAAKKQNTIAGLFAQVTSMFTEAIVKAFEQRVGNFEQMLTKVRDYFASPETTRMIQSLIDMVVEIGKVMGFFIKTWATLYSMCPDLIKTWVVVQMFFTQLGTLMAPVVALTGAFTRFRGVLMGIAGMAWGMGAARVARGVSVGMGGRLATAAAMSAPLLVGGGASPATTIKGNVARNARRALEANKQWSMGLVNMGPEMRARVLETQNQATLNHYAAVRERANRMYGWQRIGRTARLTGQSLLSGAMFANLFSNMGSLFASLKTGLIAVLAGIIKVLPWAALVIGVSAAGYGLWQFSKSLGGMSEAQVACTNQIMAASDQMRNHMLEYGSWHQKFMEKLNMEGGTTSHSTDDKAIEEQQAARETRKETFGLMFTDWEKGATKSNINTNLIQWQQRLASNPMLKLALGNQFNTLIGAGMAAEVNEPFFNTNLTPLSNEWGPIASVLYNNSTGAKQAVKVLQQKQIETALMLEGARSEVAQKAIEKIITKRDEFDAKKISEEKYKAEIQKIKEQVQSTFLVSLTAENMTPAQFLDSPNLGLYTPFQTGVMNIIDSYINNGLGTYTGIQNAWATLRNPEVEAFSENWNKALSEIAGTIQLTHVFHRQDGKLQEVKFQMATLANRPGLNLQSLVQQIIHQTDGALGEIAMTMQTIGDLSAQLYRKLAELGVMTADEAKAGVRKSLETSGRGWRFKDLGDYYDQYIGSDENSEWVKNGIGKEKWIRFMQGVHGKRIKRGNRWIELKDARDRFLDNVSSAAVNSNFEGLKVPSSTNTSETATDEGKSTGNNTPSYTPPSQDKYASAYSPSMARPTQVVFNIGSMASFDRTTVSSSAEERDLMAQIEPRIAEAVYMAFSQAAAQMNNMIDQPTMA